MKNNGSVEKRVEFLETMYAEDRKRWARAERVMVGMLRLIQRQGEKTDEVIRQVKAQGEQLKAQGERLDIVVKMFRRKFEE